MVPACDTSGPPALGLLALTPSLPGHSHPGAGSSFFLSHHEQKISPSQLWQQSSAGCLQPSLCRGQQPQSRDTGTCCVAQRQRGAKVLCAPTAVYRSPSRCARSYAGHPLPSAHNSVWQGSPKAWSWLRTRCWGRGMWQGEGRW